MLNNVILWLSGRRDQEILLWLTTKMSRPHELINVSSFGVYIYRESVNVWWSSYTSMRKGLFPLIYLKTFFVTLLPKIIMQFKQTAWMDGACNNLEKIIHDFLTLESLCKNKCMSWKINYSSSFFFFSQVTFSKKLHLCLNYL